MLNMLECALLYLNKQCSVYARILNVSDAVTESRRGPSENLNRLYVRKSIT